jgi:hypothetical protein
VALEKLSESLGINSAWESIRENIKTSVKENVGYHRLKHNKPWFDDDCSKLIDHGSRLSYNVCKISGDNLSSLRCGTRRTFRNKKKEYLRGKINELETNNKNKNIRDLYRGINEFKKGYQPRINLIKDENGNLLADPQSVLNRWKNFFNQILNVHGVHDVRQLDV